MDPITLLQGKRLLLGVTGSIACYKAVDLASKLTQAGARIDVIMTESAQKFVTPLTFQAVTGRAVYTDMWTPAAGSDLPTHIAHIGLGEGADLFAIIPATADTLARLAGGFARDLLAVTALAARCPLLIAPAMDGGMYANPAVQANLETLRARGAFVVEPDVGRFASGLVGKGRLPETPELLGAIRLVLGQNGALAGRRVVITAGGTREAVDPVRYISNRSSGKQGYALAQAALDAGAQVTLISAARHLPEPLGALVVPVDTAVQMRDAVLAHAVEADADVLIMAAAVADYRPKHAAEQKIKKLGGEELTLDLVQNPDILMDVKARRARTHRPRLAVGFAAESEHTIEHGREKLIRKGLEMLIANDISASDAGFEVDTNRVILLTADATEPLALMSKAEVAEAIIARVALLLGNGKMP
ncbi:MAG: bifunctional phosphopantothenoylcysteine decarboxylase/phosphopantothenate--cysteine ligase CoaBC [Anaerolineae bacterium]|nr:bifunctional phosphopantothenoylcysteine decarboxylase/phosphopantothenate--cysteine ligase CoaBC [Anaerolineae bacterium]